MGIETIFFISLAITFLLMIGLVYHFYNKMNLLDLRISKVIDAMNMLVTETGQELETTKNGFDNKMAQLENVVSRIVQPSYAYPQNEFDNHPKPTTNENSTIEINLAESDSSLPMCSTIFTPEMFLQKSIDLGNESDDLSSDSEEEEEEEEDEDEDCVHELQDPEEHGSHAQDAPEEQENQKMTQFSNKIVVSDTESDLEPIQFQLDHLVINKLDASSHASHVDENENENGMILPIYNKNDSDHLGNSEYRKLDVANLRAMAMQRGIDQKEVKKMKKNELISLLEESPLE